MGKKDKSSRPSHSRREMLKAREANKVPPISNLTPIDRYYDVADKLKELFESNMDDHHLDHAYVYGIRFAKFSAEALPQHDYYKAPRRELQTLRKKNQTDLKAVISALEKVVELMDLEELEKAEIRRREEEALRKIKEREERMRKEEEDRLAQKQLADRLKALDTMFPETPSGIGESQTNAEVDLPSYEDAKAMMNKINDMPIGGDMPPPIPYSAVSPSQTVPTLPSNEGPPPPPPSYSDLLSQNSRFAHYEKDSISNLRPADSTSSRDLLNDSVPQQHHNYANNGHEPATLINPLSLGPLLPASLDVHGEAKQSTFKIDVPISSLKYNIMHEYQTLQRMQKVQVFQLGTYQGKYSGSGRDSTNGCTVISPLVAIHHLSNTAGASLPDAVIERVIDEVAPKILVKVRRKLGLAGQALIIPSDVHDFLVDEKILKQEMFVGVCGGNIIDGDHLNEFIRLLEDGEEAPNSKKCEEEKIGPKKIAAALFFHEHVVSILKVVLPDGTTWYDLVDSLPRSSNGQMGGTRTRCKDLGSFQALLQWYAINKFSPADEKYIDTNQWDDIMCNFDPRVFQAFVWKE